MITIRTAQVEDVAGISDVFHSCYGDDYTYPEFYDAHYLLKMVCADTTLLLVAEDTENKRIAGTASVLMDNTGAYSDMVGEFGRLAVHPDYRNQGVGKRVLQARLAHVQDRLHVGLMDARVTHPYTVKIASKQGFACVGFLPQKYNFSRRESLVQMVRYFGQALALRKNHPAIIPEVYPLAHAALGNCGLTPDAVVDEHSAPYPYCHDFDLQTLTTDGYASLIRMERGRVRHREIFGPLRLQYGFFKLHATHAQYLVARQGGCVVGAVGFIRDDYEHNIRIFELISLNDEVIRFLLSSLVERARHEYGTCYMELDVSAYAPRMQRTALELGFVPAAYLPSMVFDAVERLDVVKMVNLLVPLDLGPLALEDQARQISDIVLRGFVESQILPVIRRAVDELTLFNGLNEEQTNRLAAIFTHTVLPADGPVFKAGEASHQLYVVTSGSVGIFVADASQAVGRVNPGECLGEVAMLTGEPHSATAIALEETACAVLSRQDLQCLIRQRPDIGVLIYKNLALGLGQKLRRSGPAVTQLG
ncbi:MAG: GNAT family N-acetyltransferase [Cyanobacteria bacterium HKST-UBA04]|nr:GNAT family N-acetyltransferase [Cyanobacteria bacterium HKST-UBA04]